MKQTPKRPWRLSTQLIGLSLTIALPLAALLGYNLHRSDERDKHELGTVALQLADSAAKNAEFLLADARRALTVLAQRPALLALDRNACDPLLGDIQKLQPVYRNARTVNRDGVLICSALAPVSAASAKPDLVSWFNQVHDSMQFTIGTPALGVISKRWEVTLAYPMRGAQGEFIGAVALSLDLDDYPLMPASTPLPRGAVAGIASYAGVVIARSSEAGRPVGSSTLQSKLRAAALAAESGQLEIVGTDAIPRIYAFTPIQRSGWYAVAGISAADVYAESRTRLLQSLLLVMAVLLLASASAFAVARRIEQPLRRLADAAGAVAAGDRAARAPLGGSREAVSLGSRFNAMLDALDVSERHFRETMENVHMVAVALDERGNVTYCNDFTVELSGWQREELLGRNWFDTVLQDPEPVRMVFERAMIDGNLPLHFENEIITRGGKRRLIHWNNTILRDAATRILGTVSLGEDITERKRAEDALRHAHESLRCFVDANIVGVVIASPSGGVTEANDYYLHTIGYTREEFEQGMVDWRAITPPEWLPADERAIKELRERGTCTPYEKEYVRRDGTRVSVFLSDAMLPGPEEQIAAFVLDITERKRTEEKMAEQLHELQRWHDVMLDREDRVIVLKKEVNELLARAGEPPRYPSAVEK